MLFSAGFRDPSVSLNVSVAFVVLLGMLSLLGLQGDKSRSGSREVKNLDRGFAPCFEVCREIRGESTTTMTAVNVLVTFSRLLPQRYFFNIARLPTEKNVDDGVRSAIESELERLAGTDDEDDSVWWRKNVPMTTNLGWAGWGLTPSGEPDNLNDLASAISGVGDFEKQHRIHLYWRLLRRALLAEITPMGIMCIICLVAVNACVLVLPVYRQLR